MNLIQIYLVNNLVYQMSRHLSQVLMSPINKSTSKECHAFGKQSRFPKQIQTQQSCFKDSCQRSSYDLKIQDISTSIMLSKSRSKMNHQKRFYKQNAEIRMRSSSPSPNSYMIQSFIDSNLKKTSKSSFIKDQKLKLKVPDVPGPGNYQPKYNPESQLSYTMRSKPQRTQTHWNKAGPGQYFIQNKTSRIDRNQLGKIPRDTRFKNSQNGIPAPGTYKAIGEDYTKYSKAVKYSFGKSSKAQRIKTETPGPGTYRQFSEFPDQMNLVSKIMSQI